MENVIFNFYDANIKKSEPLGEVSLDYMLNAIKSPKQNIKHIFEQIKQAERSGDMATKQQLKTKLYSFTPCVYVKGSRKYDNIVNFTGILVLDFDHLPNSVYAEEFKKFIFNQNKFILAAWLSASRHGVRALVKIPVCQSVEEFKTRFAAIQRTLEIYNGFDRAPKNCILPMFISYDDEILIRNDAQTFNEVYIEPERPKVQQYITTDKTSSVEKIILKKINAIHDNGHPQLRAAAYLLGGYCGAGHIEYNNAIAFINNLIKSNGYLSQKPEVYIKTAKQMIDKGINEPVYLPQ